MAPTTERCGSSLPPSFGCSLQTRPSVFILGVYPSALDARWKYGPCGSDHIQALAIANEPEPFWDSTNQLRLIARHRPHLASSFPLHRTDCRARLYAIGTSSHLASTLPAAGLPMSLTPLNTGTEECILGCIYASQVAPPDWSLPIRPRRIVPDEQRLAALESELREASPTWLITLGDEPLATLSLGHLSQFDYGRPIPGRPFGIDTNLLSFTYPRNAGRFGKRHSKKRACLIA